MNDSPDSDSHQDPGDTVSGLQQSAERELNSEELLQGNREIRIRHGEEIYRLRLTRNGKLILQK